MMQRAAMPARLCLALSLALSLVLSCHAADVSSFGKPRQVERVSLVSLIADPDKYDGKPVRVIGAVRLEFEGNTVCLHQEDQRQALSNNCLWIRPDLAALGATTLALSALSGQYVLLEGTFSKDDHGHMGMYSGAITGIWRAQAWNPVR